MLPKAALANLPVPLVTTYLLLAAPVIVPALPIVKLLLPSKMSPFVNNKSPLILAAPVKVTLAALSTSTFGTVKPPMFMF